MQHIKLYIIIVQKLLRLDWGRQPLLLVPRRAGPGGGASSVASRQSDVVEYRAGVDHIRDEGGVPCSGV